MGYLYIWKCFLYCQELSKVSVLGKILRSGETQVTDLRDHIKFILYLMTKGIIYPTEIPSRFDDKNN